MRAALVCLHNQIRVQNGLGTLAENGALAAAAAAHSDDMLRRDYFAHDTPEGGSFVDRIIAARYAGRNDGWTLGENLAWGTGDLSTPAALMNSWMNSPGHRENVLKADYRGSGPGHPPRHADRRRLWRHGLRRVRRAHPLGKTAASAGQGCPATLAA